jgi:hypothetical protein
MPDSNPLLSWARQAAERLLVEFSDATAIDTADYQLCSFIIAAAELALANDLFAAEVELRMEDKRPDLV